MASSTLLPPDLARRRKDDDPDCGVTAAAAALVQQAAAAAAAAAPPPPPRDGSQHQHHHDVLSGEACFSVLHDLVATAADGGHHSHAAQHVPVSSASSSLLTSIGNGNYHKGCPDRGLSMLFSKPPPAHAAKLVSPLGSWASTAASARAAVSIAHMPVFNA
jgi:AP2-like factor, ANT lineage